MFVSHCEAAKSDIFPLVHPRNALLKLANQAPAGVNIGHRGKAMPLDLVYRREQALEAPFGPQ